MRGPTASCATPGWRPLTTLQMTATRLRHCVLSVFSISVKTKPGSLPTGDLVAGLSSEDSTALWLEEWGTFILSAKGLVRPQERNHQGDSAGPFLSGDRRSRSGLNDELLSLGLKKNTSSALSTTFLSNSMGEKNLGHFKKMPLKMGWRASKHLELFPGLPGGGSWRARAF